MKKIKIIVVAGARPNFMKVAPFMKQIEHSRMNMALAGVDILDLLVHTGQHYDENMSDVFFRELGLRKPDINLGVGSGSHAVQTAKIMMAFEEVSVREKPDWVVVAGDVNSTMACAIVCAKMGIRLAHIEAGLRSFDRTMPEEINRVVTDALADLLFTPSRDADNNLIKEGIAPVKIKLVGNIMIDSLVANLAKARSCGILTDLDIRPGNFLYVTLHRPANVDRKESLSMILEGLKTISHRLPVVFPIHPRTRKMLEEFGLMSGSGGLYLLDPIGYLPSLALTENARIVLTDSGGLQEEATYFRTPCLTLRPNTERPVTITLGSNRLTRIETILADVEAALAGPERIGETPPLWDGHAAERTVNCMLATLAGQA